MPSFPLHASPDFYFDDVRFSGDIVQHQGLDVAIFLQADRLLKVAGGDNHDGRIGLNSLNGHDHIPEKASWRRRIFYKGLWQPFGYLAAKADP